MRKYRVFDQPHTFPDFQEVPVSRELHASIQTVNKQDWKAFFQNIRLLFRSRIAAANNIDEIKGKLQGVDEIENIIIDMMKPEK